jgi:two-component system response regulator MprA
MNSKKFIMVVEDSDDIRELIGRFFKSEGIECVMAVDGQDALEKLRVSNELPSVILLDLMMPRMDGFQFRHEQQKDQKLSDIPVLLMTADANADEKAKIVGARGYLRKPVQIKTLLAVAEKFCSE